MGDEKLRWFAYTLNVLESESSKPERECERETQCSVEVN